jgi:hypothetical protein
MRAHPSLLLAVGLTLAACGDTFDPSTVGTLVVSTSTEGNDPDPDGYLLTVDRSDSLVLAPTDTTTVIVPPGRHTLRLLGVAAQCSVVPAHSLEVESPPHVTTRVAYEISCPLTGASITTTTTGLDYDPNGYRVEVDGTDVGILPSNGTVPTRLAPGSRTLVLTGLAPNCTVSGSGSQTVIIRETEATPVEFAVVCTATRGVIGVAVEASGIDIDGEYRALVDGTPFRIVPNGTAYLRVLAGHHVVSLATPANCSVETEPQSVILTAGGLIRDTVTTTFSVTCTQGSATLRVTASITGPAPARGFEVWVCPSQLQYYCDYGDLEQDLGVVQPNGTLIAQVRPSTYNIELRNLPTSCRVNAPNPKRGVRVPNGRTIAVSFPVVCSA